ncbi:MAG: MerC domain-containing protein [Bacteroidota bacterium]
MKNQFIGLHLDFIGFGASLLCALHCAALPLLITFAPLAGLQFLDNPSIEYAIILFSFFIASNALIYSYRKYHHKFSAIAIAAVGFVLIGLGRVVEHEWKEALFTSLGGITIAIAHLMNWRLMKQSRKRYPGNISLRKTKTAQQ